MRTKLFPDEAAEALDELEYHPHHVYTSSSRAPGGMASTRGSGTSTNMALTITETEATVESGADDKSSLRIGANSKESLEVKNGPSDGNIVREKGNSGVATPANRGGEVRGEPGSSNSGGAAEAGTMMQRMNKTFRPDPLSAYTGDRITLRFKPRRQEGLTTLRPRQVRTVFDASQISPMLQVTSLGDLEE